MKKIIIFDTTLRDGAQTDGVSFSSNDKIKIAEKLDGLGVHYIEGGWPGSNPKDKEFFEQIQKKKLNNSKIVAFGSTRRANIKASEDNNLRELIKSKAPTVTIFGKTWDLHVTDVIKTTLDENLNMIADSLKYLKKKKREVFYDAEHFFDGFKNNPEYALDTIRTAQSAGAQCIILCDTNGGTLPSEIKKIIEEIKAHIDVPLGIHAHDDQGLAIANSLVALEEGCMQVQGTFNGLGERCGNANLGTIIGILSTKMNLKFIPQSQIKNLKQTCYFISEISNSMIPDNMPFVGHSAFTHKGGVHIDAVIKNSLAYEHVSPEVVGNHRRIIASELAGKIPILIKAQKMGIKLDKKSKEAKQILKDLQRKELLGYQFEAADASFELFVKKSLKKYKPFFGLESFKAVSEKRIDGKIFAEASIRVKVHGEERFSASEGSGPVDALDKALRKVLVEFYPQLYEMHLKDYKVRVIDTNEGAAARVRVLIESQDKKDTWTTVGVHNNIIEASWEALIDSIEYKLLKDKEW